MLAVRPLVPVMAKAEPAYGLIQRKTPESIASIMFKSVSVLPPALAFQGARNVFPSVQQGGRPLFLSASVLALGQSGSCCSGESWLAPGAAHAQPVRNMLARLRAKKMPADIAKTNGRIEAIQVDVSAKYAGRLAEVSVEEGSSVKAGQVVGWIVSPEYEAKLKAAQSEVERTKQILTQAEAEIASH